MMRRRTLVLGLALVMCALPVHAQDDEDYEEEDDFGRAGFYLSTVALYAFKNFYVIDDGYFTGDGTLPESPVGFDNSFGFNFRAGYRAQPHFAAELEYEYVNGFDRTLTNTSIRTHVFTVNVKVPFTTGRLQPFLGYGMGSITTDAHPLVARPPLFNAAGDSKTNFAMRFYGGLDVYIDNHWMVQFETSYLLPVATARGLDYVTAGFLGVGYRF